MPTTWIRCCFFLFFVHAFLFKQSKERAQLTRVRADKAAVAHSRQAAALVD
jgi:hypothetical protein